MATVLEYHRPRLYPKQREAIFSSERISVIEASTKSGKTSGCLVWLFEQALAGKPGWVFWWVAPVFAQAKMAFRRLKGSLPRWLYRANETELTLTITPPGSVIFFKSADNPDSLYGEDVHAAVIDEASRCKEEAWHAVRTTLTATQGPIRVIGNVRGKKNWAYFLARRAESGDPGMVYSKLTAYDAVEAGVVSLEEVEEARRQLPEPVFKELYLAEPTDDGGNPFGWTRFVSVSGRCLPIPLKSGGSTLRSLSTGRSVSLSMLKVGSVDLRDGSRPGERLAIGF